MSSSEKQSAKQQFISFIEQKILSGEYAVDQKLPPERDLAEQTGISRITVHAALVELATKNVLRIVPRQGTFVGDFKKDGTLELYGALLKYTGNVEHDLFHSLTEFREILETAAAQLAALNRTSNDLEQLLGLLAEERSAKSAKEAAKLDYLFHLQITKASGNIVIPMTLRSIENMYMSLVTQFYEIQGDREAVYAFHERIIFTIEKGNAEQARSIMKAMLDQGRSVIEKHFADNNKG
jgi:DNA-binding FadR family transcriptional regulator